MRLSVTAARMRSFKAASLIFSPSWISMARRVLPSRLELKRPEGSFSAAPLAKVILTWFLYVSPVQTMPAWEKTGVPIHFHSSTISGSASCMISRTFASVFPRQSPSFLIFSSINAEADSTGRAFMYSSSSRTYSSCAQAYPATSARGSLLWFNSSSASRVRNRAGFRFNGMSNPCDFPREGLIWIGGHAEFNLGSLGRVSHIFFQNRHNQPQSHCCFHPDQRNR